MSSASSTAELFDTMASTTGRLIEDSLPAFYYFLGLIIAVFVLAVIIKAFKSIKIL